MRLDLSKQPWDASGLAASLALAEAAGLETARAALFAGEPVNASEARPAFPLRALSRRCSKVLAAAAFSAASRRRSGPFVAAPLRAA